MRYWKAGRIAAILACATGLAMAQQPTEAETKEANVKAYVDLLRKDIKSEKRQIVTALMVLTPAEAAKFWPLYNEYDKGLDKLGDDRVALVKLYAQNAKSMTDAVAKQLATGVIDKEASRIQLKREYMTKIAQAVNPIAAARFLQIELQLEKLLDLQIYSNLPIIE